MTHTAAFINALDQPGRRIYNYPLVKSGRHISTSRLVESSRCIYRVVP